MQSEEWCSCIRVCRYSAVPKFPTLSTVCARSPTNPPHLLQRRAQHFAMQPRLVQAPELTPLRRKLPRLCQHGRQVGGADVAVQRHHADATPHHGRHRSRRERRRLRLPLLLLLLLPLAPLLPYAVL